MDIPENDFKYLISAYKNTSSDLFTQSIALQAKVRQLTDVIQTLSDKVKEQQEQIQKLSKPRRTSKQKEDDGTF
jgi:hypothetical protein|tara:strand:- start:214 stop:435 length:222 start_codon:yes stop_codon:yes gene_type:complete